MSTVSCRSWAMRSGRIASTLAGHDKNRSRAKRSQALPRSHARWCERRRASSSCSKLAMRRPEPCPTDEHRPIMASGIHGSPDPKIGMPHVSHVVGDKEIGASTNRSLLSAGVCRCRLRQTIVHLTIKLRCCHLLDDAPILSSHLSHIVAGQT